MSETKEEMLDVKEELDGSAVVELPPDLAPAPEETPPAEKVPASADNRDDDDEDDYYGDFDDEEDY